MGILDWVFIKKCLGCGRAGCYVCRRCLAEVGGGRTVCPECGYYAFGGRAHKSCRKTWGLDGRVAVWEYEGVVRKAIQKLKYNFVSEIADELARAMVNELKNDPVRLAGMVVLPMPLHKGRERWRGFNQAEEVGRKVAKGMGWEFRNDWLRRIKKTEAQVGKKRDERRENVRGAFIINSQIAFRNGSTFSTVNYHRSDSVFSTVLRTAAPVGLAITKNISFAASDTTKKIIIFDDVWTTGATIKECAKVLKRKGFKEVWGMTIAG